MLRSKVKRRAWFSTGILRAWISFCFVWKCDMMYMPQACGRLDHAFVCVCVQSGRWVSACIGRCFWLSRWVFVTNMIRKHPFAFPGTVSNTHSWIWPFNTVRRSKQEKDHESCDRDQFSLFHSCATLGFLLSLFSLTLNRINWPPTLLILLCNK